MTVPMKKGFRALSRRCGSDLVDADAKSDRLHCPAVIRRRARAWWLPRRSAGVHEKAVQIARRRSTRSAAGCPHAASRSPSCRQASGCHADSRASKTEDQMKAVRAVDDARGRSRLQPRETPSPGHCHRDLTHFQTARARRVVPTRRPHLHRSLPEGPAPARPRRGGAGGEAQARGRLHHRIFQRCGSSTTPSKPSRTMGGASLSTSRPAHPAKNIAV